MAKRYEELTFVDDFMFGKVMEDKGLCHDVLEQLLNEPVGELEDVESQKEFRYTKDGKPIRLDMYTKDQKRMYDAEMQNLNHQSVENLELPKRSRFYQSSMDTDHLEKGRSYHDLPEGRVLFICTFDPFGRGYAKYSFRNRCDEDQELCLKDGTVKIFFNCTCDADNVPENLREIFDYIKYGKVSGDLTRRIDAAVQKARKNEEWRAEYMKELLHDDDVRRDAIAEGRTEWIAVGRSEGIAVGRSEGIAVGRSEGRSEERINAVQRLLAKGAEMNFIQSLDYSEDEIKAAKEAMVTTP